MSSSPIANEMNTNLQNPFSKESLIQGSSSSHNDSTDAISQGEVSSPKGVSSSKIGDTSIKQGSYGKVKIHKHSKLTQLMHIDEVFAAICFLLNKEGNGMKNQIDRSTEDVRFCDDMLGKVSRSFSAVIR
jgi:hypothetical protein